MVEFAKKLFLDDKAQPDLYITQ